MASLLNEKRPPAFCPGCSHDRVLKVLDSVFQDLALPADKIVMVSDIGCSGLFDTFFNTHALHGLHGRALTYAAGLKLARPELNVVVTMGDGGMGIGGAHLLAACRRNLDLTLLVLNNYNFGMTGGQFSATTPPEAQVGSGFLNTLEKPLDVAAACAAAGAPFVARCSAYDKQFHSLLASAIRFQGFSVLDIHGICPGRYLRRNKLTPKMIAERITQPAPYQGPVEQNRRPEYGSRYRELAASLAKPQPPAGVPATCDPPQNTRCEVLLLGAAGQRILTAGEIIGIAGLSAGLHVTQKNEYNITVMTGPSISELILSPEEVDYTGSKLPSAVLVTAPEGVQRRQAIFSQLPSETLLVSVKGVALPQTQAEVMTLDFKQMGIKQVDWALCCLAVLAARRRVLTPAMLDAALRQRFKGTALESSRALVQRIIEETVP